MKAVVQDRYGAPAQILRVEEVPEPRLGADWVLVKVLASAVHADVWHAISGKPYILRAMFRSGLTRPTWRIPGADVSGVVERVGVKVTAFKPGDEVFGSRPMMTCWVNGSTYAQYAAFHPDGLVMKPANVSHAQAAAVAFSGMIALVNLGDTAPLAGAAVLVNGAAGAVGSIALQLAKAAGAHVTGVDAAEKLALLTQLGADAVIDYGSTDVTRGKARYDLVFDVASNLSVERCRRILTPNGHFLPIGHDQFGRAAGPVLGSLPKMVMLMPRARFDRHIRRFPRGQMAERPALLETLRAALEAGVLTPQIGAALPLDQAGEALRLLEGGNCVGRIVIEPWR